MAVPYMRHKEARGSNRTHNIGVAVFSPFIQQACQDGGTAPLTSDGQDPQTSQARRKSGRGDGGSTLLCLEQAVERVQYASSIARPGGLTINSALSAQLTCPLHRW